MTKKEPNTLGLSRDAEVTAYCCWGLGIDTSLKFQRPHVITPRFREILDELTKEGLRGS